MSTNGNAFNAKKGWAVASLIIGIKDKFKLGSKFNFKSVWKMLCTIALALAFSKIAHATGTDLLASQNTTVDATFGADSSMVKWFYIAEILIGGFLFIKSRSPLVFGGIVLMIIATKIGFSIAS